MSQVAVVVVRKYSDVRDAVESEICRLLRVDPHRRPAFLESQSFWAFRSSILDLLDRIPCGSLQTRRCYLPQGLVVEACSLSGSDAAAVEVEISFFWEKNVVDEEEAIAQKKRKRDTSNK